MQINSTILRGRIPLMMQQKLKQLQQPPQPKAPQEK
jgi:hypothetical protein